MVFLRPSKLFILQALQNGRKNFRSVKSKLPLMCMKAIPPEPPNPNITTAANTAARIIGQDHLVLMLHNTGFVCKL